MKKLIIFSTLLFASCSTRTNSSEPDLVRIQIQDRNGISETISIPEKLKTYQDVDFLSHQPFKKVIRVYKQQGKNHSIFTTYHANGSLWQYLEAQDMRAFGLYQEWFPSGQLKIQAHVIGGTADVTLGVQSDWLFEGLSQVWDEQGRCLAEIPYEKGVLQGTSLHYYPNGQISESIPYAQNLIEGEYQSFFPSGLLKEKILYQKGKKEGQASGYTQKASLAWEETYEADLLLSGAYFSPDGMKVSSVEEGKGFQTFFQSDLSFQQIEVKQGRQEGAVKKFSPEGKLLLSYQMIQDKKTGEEIEYYANGEKKLSIQWLDDMIHGMVHTWYEDGALSSQRTFARNKKNGDSCAWYRDGSLMLVEEYEQDALQEGKYFKKGQPHPVSTIARGNGIATLYDEEGIFLKKAIYAKGKPLDPEE